MKQRNLLIILILLFVSPNLLAQRQDAAENSLLPAIDPQDIEIRSEFRARFPGLSRQPILGFNPKPRIYTISPDRMPFMETPEEAVASIIVSQLSLPAAPPKRKIEMPARSNIYVKAGLGSFLTSDVQGYFSHRDGAQNLISGNININASNGHLSEQASGYNYFDANVIYSHRFTKNVNIALKGEVFSDFNHLFNLADTLPDDGSGTAKNESMGANVGFLLSGNKNAYSGWDYYLNAGLNNFYFTTPTNQHLRLLMIPDILGPYIDIVVQKNLLNNDTREFVGKTGFEKKWAGASTGEHYGFDVNFEGGVYGTFIDDEAWFHTGLKANYNRLINYNIDMQLSAGAAYTDDNFGSNIYFITDSKVDVTIQDNLSVYGKVIAQPSFKTIAQHHQNNPFLNVGNSLRTEYDMELTAGLDFIPFGGTKLFGKVSFNNIKNKAYYERERVSMGSLFSNELLFYKVSYSDANILAVNAGMTHQLVPKKLWFDGLVYFQNPRLADKTDIPYMEKMGAEAAISYKLQKNLKIHSWIQYIGKKSTGKNNPTSKIGAVALLNADIEYLVTPKISVYAEVLNILNNKYELWQGFQERPFQIFGGIKIKL